MIIFVDFDDTLCLHKNECKVNEYVFAGVDVACEYFFKNAIANTLLINYLIKQRSNGAKIILLTSASSKMLEIKKFWLNKVCPNLIFDDYIAVSIDISKTALMLGYAKWFNIPKDNILFIDDFHSERWQAEQVGIKTYNPQIIMCETK